jgi:hypothetical protein
LLLITGGGDVTAILPPPAVRRLGVPTVRPLALHRWQARRLSLSALTGQAGTLTRSAAATFVDSAGATVTAPNGAPRWESRALFGEPAVGLRLSTDDLTWPLEWTLGPRTLYLEAINLGTAQTNNQGLLYAGRNDQTGARWLVRGTGTTFAASFFNASNQESTATLGAAVANGATVQLVVHLDDDGANQRTRIGGAVNGATVDWSAYGTARARAATLGTGALLRANRLGSAGLQGSCWLSDVAVYPGLLSLAECQAML